MGMKPAGRVAVVMRGDALLCPQATGNSTRLAPRFAALTDVGLAAELFVHNDGWAMEAGDQLLDVEGVLVWVDPVTSDGDRPFSTMAAKDVLYTTWNLGWGTDTHRCQTVEGFWNQFPAHLAADGVRVFKPGAPTAVWACGR
jgi:hypothetical protein